MKAKYLSWKQTTWLSRPKKKWKQPKHRLVVRWLWWKEKMMLKPLKKPMLLGPKLQWIKRSFIRNFNHFFPRFLVCILFENDLVAPKTRRRRRRSVQPCTLVWCCKGSKVCWWDEYIEIHFCKFFVWCSFCFDWFPWNYLRCFWETPRGTARNAYHIRSLEVCMKCCTYQEWKGCRQEGRATFSRNFSDRPLTNS